MLTMEETTDYSNLTYVNSSYCLTPSNFHVNSTYFHAIIYFLYSVIFTISIFGNGMVCYVVVSSPRMRTVTNYFIMNLAVGDVLITLLCIPFTAVSYLEQYWPFSPVLCPVVNYSQGVSVFVSAYTLVAISVDRYIAIMWPLRPRLSKSTSGVIIFLVWAIAILTALPIAITSRLVQPDDLYILCERSICREDWLDIGEMYGTMYTKALLIMQYVIPLSVLIFTYSSIAVMIWCHRIPGEAENCRDQRIAKSKRKMVKMMIIVVVVYTICWLPLNLLWVLYDVDMDIDPKVMSYVFFSCHWFAMSHTCYNPVIYCYMNARFRSGFVQALASFPCTRRLCSFLIAQQQQNTGVPLTSLAGTDNTTLHRNNTSSTYVSTRLKTARLSVSTNNQAPIRSASMLRNHHETTRRHPYPKNILEEAI